MYDKELFHPPHSSGLVTGILWVYEPAIAPFFHLVEFATGSLRVVVWPVLLVEAIVSRSPSPPLRPLDDFLWPSSRDVARRPPSLTHHPAALGSPLPERARARPGVPPRSTAIPQTRREFRPRRRCAPLRASYRAATCTPRARIRSLRRNVERRCPRASRLSD